MGNNASGLPGDGGNRGANGGGECVREGEYVTSLGV